MEKKTSFGIKLLALITVLAMSWGLTNVILYLAALCFAVTFSLKIATGVWLLLFLLSAFFRPTIRKK